MRKVLALFVLFTSATGFAETRELLCQEQPGVSQGLFGISLDNAHLDPRSNSFRIGRSSWAYQFSTASMICSVGKIGLSRAEAFNCIGYNSAGGLTEVSVNLQNGVGTAKVHNFGDGVQDNIYRNETEGMILPCQLTVK